MLLAETFSSRRVFPRNDHRLRELCSTSKKLIEQAARQVKEVFRRRKNEARREYARKLHRLERCLPFERQAMKVRKSSVPRENEERKKKKKRETDFAVRLKFHEPRQRFRRYNINRSMYIPARNPALLKKFQIPATRLASYLERSIRPVAHFFPTTKRHRPREEQPRRRSDM